jgi:hypothetical protein
MATYIRRREFVSALLGGAAAWPVAARAQPSGIQIASDSSKSRDRAKQDIELARTGRQISGGVGVRYESRCAVAALLTAGLLRLKEQPLAPPPIGSFECRYRCESPKLSGDNFPAIRQSGRRPPIRVASIALPRVARDLPSADEIPHIFRKSRRPGEFLATRAKGGLTKSLTRPVTPWP